MHVVTMSIGKPPGPDSDENVYVVSVSAKGADHEVAYEHLRKQLTLLATPQPFWHRQLQATVLASAHVVGKVADDPEMRKKAGSITGTRPGFVGDAGVLASQLAPCSRCAPYVRRGEVPPTGCISCAAWDYGSPVLSRPAPQAFPTGAATLSPGAVNFSYLVMALKVVYTRLRSTGDDKWTPAGAMQVMKVMGVPDAVRTRVLGVAAEGDEEWYPANWLAGLGDGGVELINHIAEAVCCSFPSFLLFPSFFLCFIHSFLSFLSFLLQMHLFFLGVVKAFMDTVYKWAASASKATAVQQLWAQRLDALRSVKWMVVRPMSASGNWVSENYVSLCRLLPWFFSDLHLVVPSAVYEAPNRPFSRYTKKMNEDFLKACGVEPSTFCDMEPSELKMHVSQLRASDDPPVVSVTAVSAADVQVAASLLNAFVARAMQPVVSDRLAADVDAHSKAYLTALDRVDAGHRGTKGPVVLRKANHLKCLNTARSMMENGAANRTLWGGGFIGERGVKEIRENISSMQGRWEARAMDNITTSRAARLLEPRRVPRPHDHIKVLRCGAAAALAAASTHVQFVRARGHFGIVVARDRDAASADVETIAPVPGSLSLAAVGTAFWRWAPGGATLHVHTDELEHWVLLASHSGCGRWHACGESWCEVGASGLAEMPSVFEAIAKADAAAAAGADTAAAQAAASADQLAAAAAAEKQAHERNVADALACLHNRGITQLSGNKCQLLARALFNKGAGTGAAIRRAAFRTMLEEACTASNTFLSSRLPLEEGLRFEMEFAEVLGVFGATIVEAKGGGCYKCVYDDGDEKTHTEEELRVALEEHPLHLR